MSVDLEQSNIKRGKSAKLENNPTLVIEQKIQFPVDLVTFTEEILNGKPFFKCALSFPSSHSRWKLT